MWWGIYLIACGQQDTGGQWTFYSALYLTFHLRYVNGIPTQEAHLRDIPAYRVYQILTKGVLIPRPYLKLPPQAIKGMTKGLTQEVEAELALRAAAQNQTGRLTN